MRLRRSLRLSGVTRQAASHAVASGPVVWQSRQRARPPLDESGENGRVAVDRALGYVRVSRVGSTVTTPFTRLTSRRYSRSRSSESR